MHHESDTHVHRGRITKQGSRLVRWAAVESVKRIGPHTVVGGYRAQVAERRGKNVGTVAAARKQIELVYYALRDHHVRALYPPGSPRRQPTPPAHAASPAQGHQGRRRETTGFDGRPRGRAGHDPRDAPRAVRRGRAF
jgi:hypothetical protein